MEEQPQIQIPPGVIDSIDIKAEIKPQVCSSFLVIEQNVCCIEIDKIVKNSE